MSRLDRFNEHRFVGTRDDMRVYDCDDESLFARVEQRFADEGLLGRNLVQTFAPDSLAEARNRGFHPA